MIELVILRGLPGSGKSTMAKTEYKDYLYYELDHYFCDTNGRYRFESQLVSQAECLLENLVDFALARGENVVVAGVFSTKKSFSRLIDLAAAHGAIVKIIECTENYGNTHRVPVCILEQMRNEFEEL